MPSLARARTFGTEVVDELKKITWPDWPQLKNATVVIIIFVVIVSLIIFLMDFGVRNIINFVIDLFTT